MQKNKTILFFLIVLLTATYPFFYDSSTILEHIEHPEVQNPNSASIYSPIYINGNAALNTFCSGNGTTGASWESAHVIEDYEIDADGSGSGIIIGFTNLYLIIRNVTTSNSGSDTFDAGISLINSTNVKIIDTNSSNNNYGILVYNSIYINLTGNNAWNSTNFGFFLLSSNNTILSGNKAYNNNIVGFSLSYSSNSVLSGNIAWNNPSHGFSLSYSNNNLLSGNEAWNSSDSFYLFSSSNNSLSGNNAWHSNDGFSLSSSDNNSLSGNDASNSSDGFSLFSSNNNTLSGNDAWNNKHGFSSFYSNGNTFSENKVYNNILNGFTLFHSNNSAFSENNAYNNTNSGFYFYSSNNNSLSGNDAWNNENGFYFHSSSSDNTLSENDAWNNEYDFYFDLLPVVNFTVDMTQITLDNNTVQFTYTGTDGNSPFNFQWDFGDFSDNSTEQNPIHQYNSIGNYTVILTVTDAEGDLDVKIIIDYIQVQEAKDIYIPEIPEISGYYLLWVFGFGLISVIILIRRTMERKKQFQNKWLKK